MSFKKSLLLMFVCALCCIGGCLQSKTSSLVNEGKSLTAQKKYDEAIEIFTKAIEQGDKDRAYKERANAYEIRSKEKMQKGKKSEGISDITHAIEDMAKANSDRESNARLYRARAYFYVINKQPDEALKDLNKAISLNAKDASAHVLKSQIYTAKGFKYEAQQALNKAMETNPEQAKQMLEHKQDTNSKQ